jgi:hypothetical protein
MLSILLLFDSKVRTGTELGPLDTGPSAALQQLERRQFLGVGAAFGQSLQEFLQRAGMLAMKGIVA